MRECIIKCDRCEEKDGRIELRCHKWNRCIDLCARCAEQFILWLERPTLMIEVEEDNE